jgi:urea carboxylase
MYCAGCDQPADGACSLLLRCSKRRALPEAAAPRDAPPPHPRGIYICADATEVRSQFGVSQKQGEAFFGNAGVFVEKYIRRCHHIEVQIFGDGAGNVVHLGERECSIQRRHQKVLEETPSPLLDAATREELTAAAVRLGSAARYRSAGTVEFIFDEDARRFYFLEVNTRLQVEHGITELVHGGVDLVEWMLRLQLPGLEPLDVTQITTDREGHSIEVGGREGGRGA